MNHEFFIKRCFELALLGMGQVSPNPMVGAVLVKNGKIISEGYHHKHGGPHAEVDCFNNCQEDPIGATLYVNLEPCCHTRKLTPPCAPLVIQKKVAKVVISNLDPNPQVAGLGVKQLQDAGIEVITDVLKNEGEILNEIFFHRMHHNTPFIHLKAAASLDGKIALESGESKWITCEEARLDAHWGRLSCDAVLVGAQTLRSDDPVLTVRIPQKTIERQPKRIVLTKTGNLPATAQVFTDELRHRTLIVTEADTKIEVLPPQQVMRLTTLDPFPFAEFYQKIMEHGIYSLYIEGGPQIHSLFLQHQQVQRLTLYLAPKIIGSGKSLFPNLQFQQLSQALELKANVWPIGRDFKFSARL